MRYLRAVWAFLLIPLKVWRAWRRMEHMAASAKRLLPTIEDASLHGQPVHFWFHKNLWHGMCMGTGNRSCGSTRIGVETALRKSIRRSLETNRLANDALDGYWARCDKGEA